MSPSGSVLADPTRRISDTIKNLTIINNYNNMNKEKKSTVATAMQLEDLSKEELIQVYREQMG
jgi:hypothetical protein